MLRCEPAVGMIKAGITRAFSLGYDIAGVQP